MDDLKTSILPWFMPIKFCKKNKIFSGYFYNIGDLYIGLGQYDSARYYLEKSLLFLTSSTRTPKFISKQWSDTLMTFQQHSSIDCLLVLRQCHLYSHYSFSKFEHLVHTHIYA